MIEKIVLLDGDVPYETVTPHILDVYNDCYMLHTYKEFYGVLFNHVDTCGKKYKCVMFPIRFFFDQHLHLRRSMYRRLSIKIYIDEAYLNNLHWYKVEPKVSIIYTGFMYKNQNLEYIEPIIGVTLPFTFGTPTKQIMCYDIPNTPTMGHMYKKMWFSVKNKNTNRYVTFNVVDRISLLLEMTPVSNITPLESVAISQHMAGLIPSINHIFMNFGKDDDNIGLITCNGTIVFTFNKNAILSDLEVLGFGRVFPVKNEKNITNDNTIV